MTRADQRKFHYIYKITRTDGSGKYYIGMHSTDDLDDGYFGSGKLLWKSIKKHGKEKHSKEILEFLLSRKELKERERVLVSEEIVNDPLCMNLQLGGGGGFISEEHRQAFLISNSQGGKKAVESGQLLKAVEKSQAPHVVAKRIKTRFEKYGNTYIGKSFAEIKGAHSEATKTKMSKAHSGEKNSQFGSCWVSNGNHIKIKKEDLDKYLANGYRRGRK